MTSSGTDTLVRSSLPGTPLSLVLPSAVAAGPAALSADAPPAVAPEPAGPTGPVVDGARLIRFRIAADHRGLHLRTGETVLCVPYEPAELGMVVLVRCESDGHAPGALLSVRGLVYLEEAGQYSRAGGWDDPGDRARLDGRAAQR